MAKNKNKEKSSFSKVLLIQESVLIWIISITFIVLAFYSVIKGFDSELPWLSTIVAFPWAAYGVSQAGYYSKSKKENSSGGIVYETAMKEKEKSPSSDGPGN